MHLKQVYLGFVKFVNINGNTVKLGTRESITLKYSWQSKHNSVWWLNKWTFVWKGDHVVSSQLMLLLGFHEPITWNCSWLFKQNLATGWNNERFLSEL